MSFDDPMIFTSLLFGAMLPYAFSALTMKSVGLAALGMIEEVRRQIREDKGILNGTSRPDYRECIRISTQASLKEMVAPGLLVFYLFILGNSNTILIGILFRAKSIVRILTRGNG